MFRMRSILTVPAVAAFAGTILIGSAPQASAQETSTITIHHRLCPTDKAVTDYFADCHDHLVGQSFEFTVEGEGGTETFTTDAATSNGSVSVAPGTIEIFGGVPGEFADTFVYCSQDQVALDLTTTDKGVSFDAPAGEVVCDWYNTPIDLSGNGGGSGDEVGEPTTLPNTGVGPAAGASGTALFALLTALGTVAAASVLPLRRRA
jgi:hypothetical protein